MQLSPLLSRGAARDGGIGTKKIGLIAKETFARIAEGPGVLMEATAWILRTDGEEHPGWRRKKMGAGGTGRIQGRMSRVLDKARKRRLSPDLSSRNEAESFAGISLRGG